MPLSVDDPLFPNGCKQRSKVEYYGRLRIIARWEERVVQVVQRTGDKKDMALLTKSFEMYQMLFKLKV